MEPPAFPRAPPATVRAAPGACATLLLPLPAGTPPFTYTWSRAGASLDDRFSTSEGPGGVRLTVTTASTQDSALYTLQASNAAGSDSARVRLEVAADEAPTGEDPPTFVRRLQDLTVKVGTRTRFLVEIVSSTECKVSWYRNERRLLEAERVVLVRDGQFWCAELPAVSADDAGRWTCAAENRGGRASCSARLNVLVPKAYKRPEFVEELRALLTEQGTVSLECKVVGVPTPALRWFKDSREIKAGDVFALTASAEDPTSLGTYTCEAVNCMGRAYSSSKVHVVGRASREGSAKPSVSASDPPPIFTRELEPVSVRICEPLALACRLLVPPWPKSVVWYNKEGKVEPGERYHVVEDGVGGYQVETSSAEWRDEGEWKCVATSAGGRVGISAATVQMEVPKNYRKPRFMENLQAVLTEEGLVSFECKVVGFPTPLLSWFKDGHELKPGDVYQLTGTNSLGSYCCIARNCMGWASSSAELTVEDIQNQLNEEEKLQLFARNQAPRFLQGLKSVEAKIDEPFTFTVKLHIPPEPGIVWFRDEQPVEESARCRPTKEDGGLFHLDIHNLELLDQAEWKCIATNDFGHSVTSCFLKLIIPRHYKKPRFLENLQAILSDEGAVNLECKVIGVPQPVLKWYKDGEELKPGDIHRIISGQDGTCCLGTYTCEARNCMGIAASSASLLGFDDSMNAKKKKAEEEALQRNLSLSTIHEERTSQMYDTPLGDITLDDKGEISFSFDGKEVSVSLYETPDLTEEEALQIVEMYADQLSENVTEHNVVELPPLRFVKETSTSGNLLMEAIIIDVSPEYFVTPDEDLRTEADIEDISIADENLLPQLSLDADVTGEDYLEKTMAILSEEKSDVPKMLARKKSDSMKSGDDFYSLSREQLLSEDKKDDDTEMSESFASARSSERKAKTKNSKQSEEIFKDTTETSKTKPVSDQTVTKERARKLDTEPEQSAVVKPKRERRNSRASSRKSSSGSEKSLVRSNSKDKEESWSLESAEKQRKQIDSEVEQEKYFSNDEFKTRITSISTTLWKVINEVQNIERDIILKSKLMSSAATASRSLEIISSLINPLTEIHSIADAAKESEKESKKIVGTLFNRLPQPLKTLQQNLTIIEKCIDLESETKTLVNKTCIAVIQACGNKMQMLMSEIRMIASKADILIEENALTDINMLAKEILNALVNSANNIKSKKTTSELGEIKSEEPSFEIKHLRDTQKALFELKSPLNSLLSIADSADSGKILDVSKIKNSDVILTDMSASIQDLQSALEQVELLSVKESTTDLYNYNTEVIERVMDSVLRLRNSFEQLSTETKTDEEQTVLKQALASIKHNICEISSHIDIIEKSVGKYDVLQNENKLEILQKMAQILISLENNLPRLEVMPSVKVHIDSFHKNLTKILENVIESNEANKYFTLMEICGAVNRMNHSIKNIDTDIILSLASLGNTMTIIQDYCIKNVFEPELNCLILSNISDILISIQEAINHADEVSMRFDSEHIEDIHETRHDTAQTQVVIEHIDHTIAAISSVKLMEATTEFNAAVMPVLETICPVLEDLKNKISSRRLTTAEQEEQVSEISEVLYAQTLATPVYELNQNIEVLNQIIVENLENIKENSVAISTIAEPLHELHTTLEVMQQDILSQCGENVNSYNVSENMASAVQSLQSCIVMIQEHAGVEAAEEMSTLQDISGIKTIADTIQSDPFALPTTAETAVEQALESFSEDSQAISSAAQALQSLNEHIIVLRTPEIIDALDYLSEISDFSSLKSIAVGLGDLHTGIEELLHPVVMETSDEVNHFINTSKLIAIASPMQELQQSLSVLDTSNIPVYEHILELPTERLHSVLQTLRDFKEQVDRCIAIVFPAMETADKTIEISNKVELLRETCENLKEIKKIFTIASNEASENNYFIQLEKTMDELLDATNVSKGINIENVKKVTEKLYENIINVQEEIIRFTPQTPQQLTRDVQLIETIAEVETNIVALEQYEFVDLSKADIMSCTSPQLAMELESESLLQMGDIVESAVNVLQSSSQSGLVSDLMKIDDFFKTCKNEFTILRCLMSKQLNHKKIIRLLQEFLSVKSIIDLFKLERSSLRVSEDIDSYLTTFLIHADDCLNSVQQSLLKIVESQSEVLLKTPMKKLEKTKETLTKIEDCKISPHIKRIAIKFGEVIDITKPIVDNAYNAVTEELKKPSTTFKLNEQVLIEKLEEITTFYQDLRKEVQDIASKDVLEKILSSIYKHKDYKEAIGTGKTLIILKCLSECSDILQETISGDKMSAKISTSEHHIDDSSLKEVLAEMLEPLRILHSQIIQVQEQVLSGCEKASTSVFLPSTESLVQTITEISKEILEIEPEKSVIDSEDISLIIELDQELHSIQNSIRSIENEPIAETVKELVKPIEDIELSLHGIYASEKIQPNKKITLDKAEELTLHINQFLELIDNVNEISSVMNIDDLKKIAYMASEFRESLNAFKIAVQTENIGENEVDVTLQQTYLASQLQKSILELQEHVFLSSQELTPALNINILQQIAQVSAQLQTDLNLLASTNLMPHPVESLNKSEATIKLDHKEVDIDTKLLSLKNKEDISTALPVSTGTLSIEEVKMHTDALKTSHMVPEKQVTSEIPKATELLLQHIDEFISKDTIDIVKEISKISNVENLKDSIKIAQELHDCLVYNEQESNLVTTDTQDKRTQLQQQLKNSLINTQIEDINSLLEHTSETHKIPLQHVVTIITFLQNVLNEIAYEDKVVIQDVFVTAKETGELIGMSKTENMPTKQLDTHQEISVKDDLLHFEAVLGKDVDLPVDVMVIESETLISEETQINIIEIRDHDELSKDLQTQENFKISENEVEPLLFPKEDTKKVPESENLSEMVKPDKTVVDSVNYDTEDTKEELKSDILSKIDKTDEIVVEPVFFAKEDKREVQASKIFSEMVKLDETVVESLLSAKKDVKTETESEILSKMIKPDEIVVESIHFAKEAHESETLSEMVELDESSINCRVDLLLSKEDVITETESEILSEMRQSTETVVESVLFAKEDTKVEPGSEIFSEIVKPDESVLKSVPFSKEDIKEEQESKILLEMSEPNQTGANKDIKDKLQCEILLELEKNQQKVIDSVSVAEKHAKDEPKSKILQEMLKAEVTVIQSVLVSKENIKGKPEDQMLSNIEKPEETVNLDESVSISKQDTKHDPENEILIEIDKLKETVVETVKEDLKDKNESEILPEIFKPEVSVAELLPVVEADLKDKPESETLSDKATSEEIVVELKPVTVEDMKHETESEILPIIDTNQERVDVVETLSVTLKDKKDVFESEIPKEDIEPAVAHSDTCSQKAQHKGIATKDVVALEQSVFSGILAQHIHEFISEEIVEAINKLSTPVNEEELKNSVKLAQDLYEKIAVSQSCAMPEAEKEFVVKSRLEKIQIAQQLQNALSTVQLVALESTFEPSPTVSEDDLQHLLDVVTQLQDDLAIVAAIEQVIVYQEPVDASIANPAFEQAKLKTHKENQVVLEEHSEQFGANTTELVLPQVLEMTTEKMEDAKNKTESQEQKTIAPEVINPEAIVQHIDDFIFEQESVVGTLNNVEHLKESVILAKELRETIGVIETLAASEEMVAVADEARIQQAKLEQTLQDALHTLQTEVFDSTQPFVPAYEVESLGKISKAITILQEDLKVALSSDYRGDIKEDIDVPEASSMKHLEDLLQEISERINSTSIETTVEDKETLKDALDEVQTVIIKLKRDCDGTGNDTLSETLDDLECSVRSVELQIKEDSPPELLKEAWATLQLLANNMNETNISESISKQIQPENVIEKCAEDASKTVMLLEAASQLETKEKSQLKNIVESLNTLKNELQSLKTNFSGDSETLIENGVNVVQSLNQIEDKVFIVEKDVESEINLLPETKESIITAVHSIYGSISNMRCTISSIQKQYMYESYGIPSTNFLHSIKNISVISNYDENIIKMDWKKLSKSLRTVLNHFEDIKFYINLDKTARLPSDAAFTKVILEDLQMNIQDVVKRSKDLLNKKISDEIDTNIKSLQATLSNIETSSTLEVKQKIPIFKEISSQVMFLTNSIKLELEKRYLDVNEVEINKKTEIETGSDQNILEKLDENKQITTENEKTSKIGKTEPIPSTSKTALEEIVKESASDTQDENKFEIKKRDSKKKRQDERRKQEEQALINEEKNKADKIRQELENEQKQLEFKQDQSLNAHKAKEEIDVLNSLAIKTEQVEEEIDEVYQVKGEKQSAVKLKDELELPEEEQIEHRGGEKDAVECFKQEAAVNKDIKQEQDLFSELVEKSLSLKRELEYSEESTEVAPHVTEMKDETKVSKTGVVQKETEQPKKEQEEFKSIQKEKEENDTQIPDQAQVVQQEIEETQKIEKGKEVEKIEVEQLKRKEASQETKNLKQKSEEVLAETDEIKNVRKENAEHETLQKEKEFERLSKEKKDSDQTKREKVEAEYQQENEETQKIEEEKEVESSDKQKSEMKHDRKEINEVEQLERKETIEETENLKQESEEVDKETDEFKKVRKEKAENETLQKEFESLSKEKKDLERTKSEKVEAEYDKSETSRQEKEDPMLVKKDKEEAEPLTQEIASESEKNDKEDSKRSKEDKEDAKSLMQVIVPESIKKEKEDSKHAQKDEAEGKPLFQEIAPESKKKEKEDSERAKKDKKEAKSLTQEIACKSKMEDKEDFERLKKDEKAEPLAQETSSEIKKKEKEETERAKKDKEEAKSLTQEIASKSKMEDKEDFKRLKKDGEAEPLAQETATEIKKKGKEDSERAKEDKEKAKPLTQEIAPESKSEDKKDSERPKKDKDAKAYAHETTPESKKKDKEDSERAKIHKDEAKPQTQEIASEIKKEDKEDSERAKKDKDAEAFAQETTPEIKKKDKEDSERAKKDKDEAKPQTQEIASESKKEDKEDSENAKKNKDAKSLAQEIATECKKKEKEDFEPAKKDTEDIEPLTQEIASESTNEDKEDSERVNKEDLARVNEDQEETEPVMQITELQRKNEEKEEIERIKKEEEEAEHTKKEKEEAERIRKEIEENERIKQEKKEADRKKKEKEAAERTEKEKEKDERIKKEKEEHERVKQRKEEADRKKKEQEEAERKKKETEEAERIKKENEEAKRVKQEKEEADRKKNEKKVTDKDERIRKQNEEPEHLKQEKVEADRKTKENEEAERTKKEKEEAERIKTEKEEAERKKKENEEAERVKQEKEEADRKKKEKEETERKKKEMEESERIKKENEEAERVKQEKEETDRKKKEKEETERKKKEMEESDRIKKENEEAERVKQEKQEADRKKKEKEETERKKKEMEESERIEKEKEEAEHVKQEKEETDRKEKEKEEAKRKKKEMEEAERIKKENEEANRVKQEKEEADRKKNEKEEAERKKKEIEEAKRIEKEKEEAEHVKQEKEETDRKEKEKEEAERKKKEMEEAEHNKKENDETERVKQEKEEAERKKKEKEEAVRNRKEMEEATRIEKEKEEAERVQQEKEEADRKKNEKEEAERKKKEIEEATRIEKEKEEAERVQQEKEKADRKKKEKEEAERKKKEAEEAERIKKEKEEAERVKQEKQEADRKKKEKEEAERQQKEMEEKEKEEAVRIKQEKEETDRKKKEKEEAKRKKKKIEENERVKKEKEEAERVKQEKEEADRKKKEKEAERKKKEMEEAERIKKEKEEAERVKQEKEDADCKNKESEEVERIKKEKEDRKKKEKEEAKLKKKEIEEAERIRKEQQETNRVKQENEEVDRKKENTKESEGIKKGNEETERILKEKEEVKFLKKEKEEAEQVIKEKGIKRLKKEIDTEHAYKEKVESEFDKKGTAKPERLKIDKEESELNKRETEDTNQHDQVKDAKCLEKGKEDFELFGNDKEESYQNKKENEVSKHTKKEKEETEYLGKRKVDTEYNKTKDEDKLESTCKIGKQESDIQHTYQVGDSKISEKKSRENGDKVFIDRSMQRYENKVDEREKRTFVDHSSRGYTMEFVRPSGYREKTYDDKQVYEPDTYNRSPMSTIYKAHTIIMDSQLRSSFPPPPEVTHKADSERRSEIRQSEVRHKTKAVSEARSLHSEKRSSVPRDIKRKPVFSTYLTDRTAVEGSRVKLTCSVLSSSEPKITWYKNGVILNDKLKYRTKYIDGLITLEVLNAVPSDSAEYGCTVENDNGSVSSSANLKVYPSFEASPIPPTFTRSIRDTYHMAENELVLECRIRGQPLPTITWMKDDKVISNNELHQACYLADGVCRLSISHPTPEDSGKYTCKAENSVWSDQIHHVVSFTGKENRLSPNIATIERSRLNRQALESRRPHFTNVLSDHKVVRGGTIGLQVEIKGSPTKVEWLREGRSVTESYENARTFVEQGLYTLALSDVTEKESGMYTCRAWGQQGTVDMNAAITVVQPNEKGGKPATIVGRPEKDLLISVGEDLNISFRVQGEPKPKVTFMKGMRDITQSPRVLKMSSDDYVKFTVKRSVVGDAGTYCVLARNAYGCDRAFVTVVVRQRATSENLVSDWTYPADDSVLAIGDRQYKSVPERIPGEPSVVDGGSNWVSLAWPKPEQSGAAPVLAYRVERWQLGKEGGARWQELAVTPLNTFDAFNLKQGERYHFRVTPRNRYGWGESVQTSSPVGVELAGDRPEFVDILPGQLKVLVGTTATLSCSVSGKPTPEVVWMKNGHEIENERRLRTSFNGFLCRLEIEGIRVDDEARYSCEAHNIHGRATTYARLAVVTDRLVWEADAKLKRERSSEAGEYPPQFTMRLRDRRVQDTFPVRLTCQVVGAPPPAVEWRKDGQLLVPDSRHVMSQEEHFHTLEIAPTQLDDDGEYEVTARNPSGAVACRCCLVVDKGIRAYLAPEFCLGLEPSYTVHEGEEVRLVCVVEAYPSVGVTWLRAGVRVRPSRRAVMTLDHDGRAELALPAVCARDAAVYTCTASNHVGQASTSTKVIVISDETPEKKTSPPTLISPDIPYSKEPMFIRKPRSSEAREGDTVIIECEVIGDPKPDVYWLRDFLKADYYRDAAHLRRVGEGPCYRLEIPHARLDYTGAYSVVAKNVHGEAKAVISLQILAREPGSTEEHNVKYGRVEVIPRFERPLTDLLCHDGDTVEFQCTVSGRPEPNIRWFHYNEVIRDCDYLEWWCEDGAARLRITQVTPDDEGIYTCEAANQLGKASSSACLVVYPAGEPNALSARLRRPAALRSAASTPRSTPRSTPARSLSRTNTPAPEQYRLYSPTRQMAPKFITYPFNKVVEEGECARFECVVAGHPAPWTSWDKDGARLAPSGRLALRERDDGRRVLEIEQVAIDDVGLYRITLENEHGLVEACARLEVLSRAGRFHAGVRAHSVTPGRVLPRRHHH